MNDCCAMQSETEQVYREFRAEQRRKLYRDDPIWRLTKLKDNRERRLRAKAGLCA